MSDRAPQQLPLLQGPPPPGGPPRRPPPSTPISQLRLKLSLLLLPLHPWQLPRLPWQLLLLPCPPLLLLCQPQEPPLSKKLQAPVSKSSTLQSSKARALNMVANLPVVR